MNYTILIHPQAEQQLEQMAFYLEEQRNGLGLAFIREFYETLDYLELYAHSILSKENLSGKLSLDVSEYLRFIN